MEIIQKHRLVLATAIARNRSRTWILRSWSRFIKARDLFRCVCCESPRRIQAHHIIRKTLYPWGVFEIGNGITLCHECHRRVHAEFNGRPDLTLPLGAEQGDDQDEWSFLFGLLRDDAVQRGLDEDEFYHLGDHMLRFFVRCQGYDALHEWVMHGEMSRIRFAHEIWRSMPEAWYTNFGSQVVRLNM
ncbi:HNH endonuclease [Ottowia sp.]|uniref:HNH endonuclease n=1 Tax=Ottowia sp. TaxID=1898956 RepID=UPI0025F33F41|nr:HNH endonuclease [Ottowia sp.]